MTSSIAIVVTSACMSFSGNGNNACNKAIEAGSIQTGIDQNIGNFQNKVEKKADQEAHYVLGDSVFDILGGGLFVAKTVADKSVKFSAPTLGICDKITNEIGVDKYLMKMEWGF